MKATVYDGDHNVMGCRPKDLVPLSSWFLGMFDCIGTGVKPVPVPRSRQNVLRSMVPAMQKE